MTEKGGPSTQAGIFYQNTIAARYLSELLDMRPQPARERVVEVRVESPTAVDDIVVQFADGHRHWIQAKSDLSARGDAWESLWNAFLQQTKSGAFSEQDRLILSIGQPSALAKALKDCCDRAVSSPDPKEWQQRLSKEQTDVAQAIGQALNVTDLSNVFELLRKTEVDLSSIEEVARAFAVRRLTEPQTSSPQLLSTLRDIAGGGSRIRALFGAAELRQRLLTEFGIEIGDPSDWGLPVYRSTLAKLARLEIPGTSVAGKLSELFIWPRARDYNQSERADFENEDPRWQKFSSDEPTIDFTLFPSERFDRCIVVAGPGFGKSALLLAIADRLNNTAYVPALVPIASLSSSELNVSGFLANTLNQQFKIAIDWLRLCEQGLAVLMFDGLDEVPLGRRRAVLESIKLFAARYPLVPWILTVRDPAVLAGPAEARIIEILPLEDEDIVRFAEAWKGHVRNIDGWDLTRHLDAYPDLHQLTKIPLFLSLLLATTHPSKPLPKNRSELIEVYLKILFQPEEHKPVTKDDVPGKTVRSFAEKLAFDRIEHQEIGASEREVQELIAQETSTTAEGTALFEKLLKTGVLRHQSAIRLEFPFPIIQEYLAACYLIRERRAELPQRVKEAVQRPWAQVVQFALELHPEPGPIIKLMLEPRDDAFYTALRLIGRCIANGTRIDKSIRHEVARRLAAAWDSASYELGGRIGHLIVDGFSSPLFPEVRQCLTHRWLLHQGAGEIVCAAHDPSLTKAVVAAHLVQIEEFVSLRPLERAINEIADDIYAMYAAFARQPGIKTNQLNGIASLVDDLSPDKLARDAYLNLALDEELPAKLRLASFCVGPTPLDARAWPLVEKCIRSSDTGELMMAERAIARHADREKIVLGFLTGDMLPEGRRHELIENISLLFPDRAERVSFIRAAAVNPKINASYRDIFLLYAARYGDEVAFEGLIDRIDTLSVYLIGLVLSLFGHHRRLDISERAVALLRKREISSSDVVSLAPSIRTGMLSIFEMDWLGGGALAPCPPHPALSLFASLVDEWIFSQTLQLSFEQRVRAYDVASQLGLKHATVALQTLIAQAAQRNSVAAEPNDWDWHHNVSNALIELTQKRRLLDLAALATLVRMNGPNSAMRSVAMIAAHGSAEALEMLVTLYAETADWHRRGDILAEIESLAGRFNKTFYEEDGKLVQGRISEA